MYDLKRLPTVFTFGLLLISTGGRAENLRPDLFDSIQRVISPSPSNIQRYSLTDKTISLRKDEFLQNNPIDFPKTEILYWHEVTLEFLAFDHIPRYDSNGDRVTLQMYGPHKASYVTAMVHLAMFEVSNLFLAKKDRYMSWLSEHLHDELDLDWTAPQEHFQSTSEPAAIDMAAYEILSDLYPNFSEKSKYQEFKKLKNHLLFSCDLNCPLDVREGKELGRRVATLILTLRQDDNSRLSEPPFSEIEATSPDFKKRLGDGSYPPGQWEMDPVSQLLVALGGKWPMVRPFVLFKKGDPAITEFGRDPYVGRLPPPPQDTDSPDFTNALQHVKDNGEDRRHRVPFKLDDRDENFHYYEGKFWSYDATPSLCAPVRLYNQIADRVLSQYYAKIADPDTTKTSRSAGERALIAAKIAQYFAVLNLAMVDAGIEAWKAKYKFLYWRPVTGVRYALAHKSPPTPAVGQLWFPLGAQNTNAAVGFNVTPPFPAYPSGHSVFGSAFFTVLRNYVPDDTGFSMLSDEFRPPAFHLGVQNPVSIDAYNFVRCVGGDTNPLFCGSSSKPATTFPSFKVAEACNSASRVWLGVHWDYDAINGEKLGREVGKKAWTQLAPPQAKPPAPDLPPPTLADCSTPDDFVGDSPDVQVQNLKALQRSQSK